MLRNAFLLLSLTVFLSITTIEPAMADMLADQVAACELEKAQAATQEAIDAAAAEQAQAVGQELAIVEGFKKGFGAVVGVMHTVLFFELFPDVVGFPQVQDDCSVKKRGFPMVVAWLIFGGLYFTLRLAFINIRYFKLGLEVITNKFTKGDEPGQVTPFQSLAAAVSGTVGLGNIAGVAVAVTMGGPGAVFWMMVAGFLGMSTKFAEVTLGHKYRQIDADGNVSGGAFYYLRDGFKDINKATLGKYLSYLFAVLCLFGAFGGGNMFQANQMVAALSNSFNVSELDWVIAAVMAVAVGIVLIGGVGRIAKVAEAIVPLMALIYILAALTVIVVNWAQVPAALSEMFRLAFSFESAAGGVIGAMIMGFRRAAFSNEAGVGSAPIVMAACKSREPVQIGAVAILEPFIDTLIICFLTGLVITVTGVYKTGDADGVLLTSQSFATVIDWFPLVLSVAVSLFAFSSMITWSYYGERAWNYLFKGHKIRLYHVMFCAAVFFGGAMQDKNNEGFKLIIDFSDLALLAMAVPNLIGLYFLSGILRKEMREYRERVKNGEVKIYAKHERAKGKITGGH